MDYITARWRLDERIREIRKEKNITQERLAELIDKTTEHVSFIERGERSPSFEVLVDLAKTLGVSLSYLLDIDIAEQKRVSSLPAPIPSDLLPEPIEDPIKSHMQRRTDLERMQEYFGNVRVLQQLANEYGISDIFQDNGGKVLQLLITLGLKVAKGREGNDAIDDEGNEYELKTINRSLRKNAGITTHHHLTKEIIDKYRKVKAWYIAIYERIELIQIWKVLPSLLEPVFLKWEGQIDEQYGRPLNNPKIPLRYVRTGELVYENPALPSPKPDSPLQQSLFSLE